MEKRLQHYKEQKRAKVKSDARGNALQSGRVGDAGGAAGLNLNSEDMIKLLVATETVEAEMKNKQEEAVNLRAKKLNENMVLDLLDLEKSVAGFTNMIDTAVSDEQDMMGCPTAFTDTIGIMMNPMKNHDARNTVETALQYEAKLHHPLHKSVCVWSFCHHQPYSIDEVKHLVAKDQVRVGVSRDNEEGTLSKYYPSHLEIRRRIELSLLLQYSVSNVYSNCCC
jgi:hypothetical protein